MEKLSIWQGQNSSKLCKSIISLLKANNAKSVMDLGCGDSYYITHINKELGITVNGYDISPNTEDMSCGLSHQADLSKIIDCEVHDFVLSLEVGEHINKIHEDVFIKNIVDHAKIGIILSWAIPCQGGTGHVNCRPNEYIIEKIHESSRFKYNSIESQKMRLNIDNKCSWFKKTLMVFL